MRKRKINKAIACFEKRLEQVPDDIQTMKTVASLLFTDARTKDAESYYDRLLELKPADIEVLTGKERCVMWRTSLKTMRKRR